MRHVGEQVATVLVDHFEFAGHGVESGGQHADLVGAARCCGGPNVVATQCHGLRCGSQFAKRSREPPVGQNLHHQQRETRGDHGP